MYDIIIAGGGPSGASLARLISNKYKVLLLEKRNFSGNTFTAGKCCGGLIAPDAQLMLARFGLGIPKSVLLSPQLFAVRTIDFDNSLERYYQRHYINIDREEFDKWLISIVNKNMDVIENCIFKSFEYCDEGVKVNYSLKGKDYTEKSRIFVGADGAFSKVRRQGFSNYPSPKLYISIQEWFETTCNMNYYGAIFDSEITDYYSWTIPKENRFILGAALISDKNAVKKFSLLKDKMQKLGFNLSNVVERSGAYLLRPTGIKQLCSGNKKVFLTGEAADFISPSSGEGISYAFRSSLALAKALDNGIDDDTINTYNLNLKSLKRNIFLKNLKCPAMYNKHIRKYIMKSGLMSIDVEKTGLDHHDINNCSRI
jgi:geranylgeranyl diphosphate/geranylgeranyl-bacteriochlorophyllide a reductase